MTFDATKYIVIEGQQFLEATVDLDGHYYRRCRFVGCELLFAGDADWGHDGCAFDDCTPVFTGRARRVLEIAANMIGRDHWLALFDHVAANPAPPLH